MKTYHLGPTTHVTSQAGVSSALWHPLGVNGSCLVTVTEDAVVRVWELSTGDRWSFDKPTLAIDLKKLADGTSLDHDFGASISGTNKGFSPDSFEMEVASACFAERGSGGWSPMTLWVAMREGDVYALCPLLPEKWSPPPTLIPSLSVSIVAKIAAQEDDPEVFQQSKLLAQQQLVWMSDIDAQEPMQTEAINGEPAAEIYSRPSKPGRVPRLQGPFEFDLAPDESYDELDTLLADIYVIGAKLDGDELMFGEEDELQVDDETPGGLSIGVVCLLASSGRISVCLDLDGIEAQWLPKSKHKLLRFNEELDPPSLLTFQVLDTSRDGESSDADWPTVSQETQSRYSFFITNSSNITFISLAPWVFRLENEFGEDAVGAGFRIELLAKGQNSIRERVYTHPSEVGCSPLSACVLISDPDLGYFLLTANQYGPISITFDSPEFEYDPNQRNRSPTFDLEEPDKPLLLCKPRPVYQPAPMFEETSTLPKMLEKLKHSKFKRILEEEVRLSPATLTIMTDAHKLLSQETHRIGSAAAELFRRCERLQRELSNQIKKANEVASRVDAITGEDCDDGPTVTNDENLEQRIQAAKEKQAKILERFDKMKKQLQSRVPSRILSDKEREWMDELALVESKISVKEEIEIEVLKKEAKEPWERYIVIKSLKEDLVEQAKQLTVEGKEKQSASTAIKVPSEVRKAKISQINDLLDRESALVEGAKSRLERLSLA
jgi:nucleoporin NUP82